MPEDEYKPAAGLMASREYRPTATRMEPYLDVDFIQGSKLFSSSCVEDFKLHREASEDMTPETKAAKE